MQAENYKPDEQFTDRGWEEMKKVLDKEMPVKRKKRRGVIWFYFLGALILASGVWFFNHKKSDKVALEKEQRVYADTDKKKETNPKFNQNQNLPAPQRAGVNQNQKIKNENSSTLNSGLITTNKVTTTSTNFSKKSNPPKNNNNIITELEWLSDDQDNSMTSSDIDANLSNEISKSNFEVVSTTVNDLNNSITNRASLTMSSISFLEIFLKEKERNTLSIDVEKFEGNKAEIITNTSSQKRKIQYGLNVGTLLDMENNQKLGGFAGAHIHFPLGKKLGIRTGLGYSLINKDLDYQYSDNQDALYFDAATIVGNPSPVIVGDYIEVSTQTIFNLKRLHYLELPVLLTYDPHQRWQLELGVNTSFLIKDDLSPIESDFHFQDESEALDLGIELDFIQTETVDLEQFEKQDYWNKWNMSAVVGASFKLNSHWNIGVQYHRSFSRFLKTNEEGVFEKDTPELISPSTFLNSNQGYSVQNRFTGSSNSPFDNSSKIKDLNTNHSFRLVVGYNF